MPRNIIQKRSKLARYGRWVGMFCASLLLLTILLHRFAGLDTPSTVNLIALAFLGGGIGLLMSVIALVRIWNNGTRGGGQAVLGIIIGGIMFSAPAWYMPKLAALPQINDISTDLKSPPRFTKIATLRPRGTNSTIYPGAKFSQNQQSAYPDIVPFTLERSYDVTFDIVKEAITRLGWDVVSESPPQRAGSFGRLEAVDKTLVFGFSDDVAVRVVGNDKSAKIDVRSASRYGRHDLGRNADRIRRLFNAIKTDLDQFERASSERRAAEQKALAKAQAKAKALARKKRLARQKARRKSRSRGRVKKRRGRRRKKRRRRKKKWNPF